MKKTVTFPFPRGRSESPRGTHRSNALRPSIAAGLLALPWLVAAQTAVLAPPAERISDAAIQGDHLAFERVQARIRALNDGGRRVGDYHLAKAQCWLDTSWHEYARNDRGAFPQAALRESETLVAAMENKSAPLATETALVNDAPRLRADLWKRTEALKQGAGFVCAAAATACAEVELVHAGNETRQQQWRHGAPYLRMAEDLVASAEGAAAACPATATTTAPTPGLPK